MKYNELLRPQIHFSPRKNWMNDPNGCVYFKGVYHLFFQYYPHGTSWGPMHWGHAVSKDLLHWDEMPVALYPDEETGMAFSGSVVVDDKNASGLFADSPGLLACYTGHISGADESPNLEHQCLAYSTDDGTTWIAYEGNPVLPNPGIKDFRDPKVFYHKASQAWVMIVAAGFEVRFYRSANLINWTESGRFGNRRWQQDGLWECPDIFPLAHPENPDIDVWVMAVSSLGASKSEYRPVQYFLGNFDGYNFLNIYPSETVQAVDYGQDFYATQSWNGLSPQEDRTIWIGWANHWSYAREVPTEPWRGVMSLPRELGLVCSGEKIILTQTPIRELEVLRQPETGPLTAPISDICELRFTIAESSHGDATLRFLFGGEGELTLQWEGGRRLLTVDRSRVSRQGFHPEFDSKSLVQIPEVDGIETIDIHLILDRSLIEIFAMSGEYTMTCQIFPEGHLKEIKAETSPEVSLIDFQKFNLDSIWNPEIKKQIPRGGKGETQ